MKFVVWGSGTWGGYVYNSLKAFSYNIEAYIDKNEAKIGTEFRGIPIISYGEYLSSYRDCIIIIALLEEKDRNDVKRILNRDNVRFYMDCQECPLDIFMPYNRLGEKKFPMEEALNSVIDARAKHNNIGIKGWNIFALAVYDYLCGQGYSPVLVMDASENECNDAVWEKISENYRVLLHEEKINNLEYILDVMPTKKEYDTKHYKVKNIPFYKFPYLRNYKNNNLKKFQSIYRANERCFIVATGPSLTQEDLETLHRHREISFGVNCIYKIFPYVSWRPKYYFACEPDLLIHAEDDILNMEVSDVFLGDLYLPFFEKNNKNTKVHRYHIKWEYDYKDIFSDDVLDGVFNGATIVYHALQFAVYMGFKKIYIIGADCEYRNGDGLDKGSHFITNYADKNKVSKVSVLHTNMIFRAYQSAREYAEKHGIEIINATRGGKLEVFKRVDFDSLFTD